VTTWREAVAAKVERQRKEARFYTPDLLGRKCPYCPLKVPLALTAAGIEVHPCCGPQAPGESLLTPANTPSTVG
jgi:hypothetical protein